MAVIGSYTAKPLWAQIKAALVQNVDELGRNPYSSTVKVPAICSSANGCNFIFTGAPAGKRLVVTNVTGAIFVFTPGVLAPPTLSEIGNGIGELTRLPTMLQAGVIRGANMVAFDDPILAYFEPGTAPLIGLDTTTGFTGEGSIMLSGYYVNLP